jgi:DNA-binding MarR family transcriptional regulator
MPSILTTVIVNILQHINNDNIIVIIGESCHNRAMATSIEQLINEVRVLYQTLVQVGDEIHRESGLSMGMRAVLEYLDRNGDATVPNMARARRVTRQRIQTLVNSLYELKLVKSINNPASQRSPLITITRKGAQTILQMRRLEGHEMKLSLDDRKIKDATETITRLRTTLEEQHLS